MRASRSLILGTILTVVGLVALACSSAPTEPVAPAAPAAVAPAPTASAFESEVVKAPEQPIAQPTRASAQPAPTVAPAAMSVDFRRGGHLIWGVGPRAFPPKWDMTQSGVWHFTEHFNRHYSGILQFSPRDGITVMPDLAESWEFADTTDNVTVTLQEGIKWHDGNPLTVDDIEYTLDRWSNPPAGLPQPRVGGYKNIAGTEKIDDLTFKVTLKQPSADFLLDMADAWHIMLPKHIAELEGGINSPERLIGTGPFKVKETERDSFVNSEANPDYHMMGPDGKPYPFLDQVTTIQFTDWDTEAAALETGQIDLAAPMNLTKAWGVKQALGDEVELTAAFSPGVMYIAMNGEKPPFNDIRARRALYLAVNRGPIQATLSTPIEELPANFVQVSYLGTADPNIDDVLSYEGYDSAGRDAALAEAKQLFEELGITEISAHAPPSGANLDSAQIIVQQLEDIGITMTIKTFETAPMRAQGQDGNYEIMFDSHAVAMANPVNFVDLFYEPGAGAFYHGAEPPQAYHDKVAEIRRTFPGPERDKMFKELDTILREDWIPKIPTLRFNEYKLAYSYVHNWDAIPAMKFIQTRLWDVWLDENAPSR